MAQTYDPSLTTDLDKVRILIGDTVEGSMQLLDEEITGILGIQASLGRAASAACKAIASKYALQVDTKNGKLSVSASQRFKHYMELADDLSKRGSDPFDGKNYVAAGMKAGGLSIQEGLNDDQDVDRVSEVFGKNMNDNPYARNSDNLNRGRGWPW